MQLYPIGYMNIRLRLHNGRHSKYCGWDWDNKKLNRDIPRMELLLFFKIVLLILLQSLQIQAVVYYICSFKT